MKVLLPRVTILQKLKFRLKMGQYGMPAVMARSSLLAMRILNLKTSISMQNYPTSMLIKQKQKI